MQEGNKSLGMLKIVQFGRETFTLSPVAYITVDFNPIPPGLFRPCSAGGGPFSPPPLVFAKLENLEHSNLAR